MRCTFQIQIVRVYSQSVLGAEGQVAVRAFTSQLHGSLLALNLRSCSVLTSLLSAATQSEDEVKGAFFLNVVVGQRSAIFELLAREDESLLVWWDTLLVLDLSFDIINSV